MRRGGGTGDGVAHRGHLARAAGEENGVDVARPEAGVLDAGGCGSEQAISLCPDGAVETGARGFSGETGLDEPEGQGGSVRVAERDLAVFDHKRDAMTEAAADDSQQTSNLLRLARAGRQLDE